MPCHASKLTLAVLKHHCAPVERYSGVHLLACTVEQQYLQVSTKVVQVQLGLFERLLTESFAEYAVVTPWYYSTWKYNLYVEVQASSCISLSSSQPQARFATWVDSHGTLQ